MTTDVSYDDLAHVLSEELNGTVQEVTSLPYGLAHRMYAAQWEQPDGLLPIIIRFFAGPRADENARAEEAALRDLFRAGYPVPEIYVTELDNHRAGAPFIVMQRLPGKPLSVLALEQPDQIPYWLERAASLLLKLHGLNWQQSFDPFHPALEALDYAERQVKWWSRQAQTMGGKAAEEGFNWLRSNVYKTRYAQGPRLVHRDFHLGNLLADGDRITGVVDWGELAIADPSVDVAWTRTILSTEASPELGDHFVEAYYLRNPAIGETLAFWEVFAACKRLTGIARQSQKTASSEVHKALCDFIYRRLTDE